MDRIWLPNSVINWDAKSQWGTTFESEWNRAYSIWEHASGLVEGASNDFNLADGITNLKRALNQRLKLIEEIYYFKNIEIPNKPKGYLELLGRYGIVRPYLMKMLLNIRNDIEHNDATPPDSGRCKEFVDVIWYFLKSTDSIAQVRTDSAVFHLLDENSSETEYWFSVEVSFENFAKEIEINGWFPNELILGTAQDETSEVFVKIMHTKQEKWSGTENHKDKLDTDIWIVGNLIPSPAVRLSIAKKLLTCY